MRRSARAATAVVVTSALGLVVAATSTPGGAPTVLAAGGQMLLADHGDGSGSGGSDSGGSDSGGSDSGSGGSGSSDSGAALDLGGALSGSHSSGSHSSESHSSESHSSEPHSSEPHSSEPHSGDSSSAHPGEGAGSAGGSPARSSAPSDSQRTGTVHLPAVEVPKTASEGGRGPTAPASGAPALPSVQLPAVQTPHAQLPAVQLPSVQVPSVQVPSVQVPSVSVPSVSVPPVSLPSVSLPPVSVPPVSLPSVQVPPVALPAVPLAPVVVPNVPSLPLTPSTPLASDAALLAPAEVLAAVLDAPPLAAALPLFGPPTGDQGVLRVAHLSPTTGAVDMYVEGPGLPRTKVASDVTYRTLSPYLAATPGVYTLEARPAGADPSTPPALTAAVAVGPHSAQTAAFVDVGPNDTPQAEVLTDGSTPAPPGKALVRVVSAAAGVGPLDVVARGGGALAQGLFYGSGSSYTEVDAKTWTMDVRTTNGETAVATVPVPSTAVATVVVGRDAHGALTVTAVPDAASAFAAETPTPPPGSPAPVTPAPVTPAPVTPAPVTPAPATPAPATPAPATPAPATPPPGPPAPATPAPATSAAPPRPGTPPAVVTTPPASRPSPTPRPGRLPRGGVPAGFGGLADVESRLVPVQVHAAPAATPETPVPGSQASPFTAAPVVGAPSALDRAPGPSLVPLLRRITGPTAPSLPALVPLTAAPASGGPVPDTSTTHVHPTGLVVPAAGIDARNIGTLGLDEGGELQAPATPHDVGWYRDGAAPGESGTAVLVGHVDSWRGPGVFWHLRDLRPGDAIDVPRSDGTVAHFAVDAVETVPKDAFPSQRVYAPTSGPSLRLITCGGPFDRSVRSYEDNVVVYASPREPA